MSPMSVTARCLLAGGEKVFVPPVDSCLPAEIFSCEINKTTVSRVPARDVLFSLLVHTPDPPPTADLTPLCAITPRNRPQAKQEKLVDVRRRRSQTNRAHLLREVIRPLVGIISVTSEG